MKCPNCKATLSCGCKLRKASNGVQGCTNCIGGIEKSLKPVKPSNQAVGKILKVTAK